MSFSLLRVPKKAALTALRGLVVGTSCTLVLITEDRRRRINKARSAIQNADKIRSAKQYHAARLALEGQPRSPAKDQSEEDALLSSFSSVDRQIPAGDVQDGCGLPRLAQVRWAPSDQTVDVGRPEDVRAAHGPSQQVNVASGANLEASRPTAPSLGRQSPRAWGSYVRFGNQQLSPAVFQRPVPVRTNPTKLERSDLPPADVQNIDVPEGARRIREAIKLGDTPSLERATNTLEHILRKRDLGAEERELLVQTAASLCLDCQRVGQMGTAARALYCLVRLGPLAIADYYASNPQRVIHHAVSDAEAEIGSLRNQESGPGRDERLAAREKLDRAIALLMPRFTESRLSASQLQEWLPVAERSMNLALDLENMIEQASNLFWRIQHYDGDPHGTIVHHFFDRLRQQGRSKPIVNIFNLVRHRLCGYAPDTWYAIGDLVADAVEDALGQDPAKALLHMTEFCPTNFYLPQLPLRTTWVTKLLYCHWQRARRFEDTLALFRQFEELGGLRLVVHANGVFRVMIQIAVEAEQWTDVDELLSRLQAVEPSSSKEARIIGLLALAKAKVGDWNGVWSEFKRIEIKDRIEDVFSPVLYEFNKTHTTREMEDFLKTYIQDLELPISPYMVNMVANRYGDIRDPRAFIDWLAYCSGRGFEIDAAFGNAIIANCRKRWDFSFDDLKLIYRALQGLSPAFVDGVTENEMISTGLRTHRRARPTFVKRQIAMVGARSQRWHLAGDHSDIRVDMRQAFVTRNYKTVLLIYKAACRRGVALDDGHLRLAVMACTKLDGRLQTALDMIREGQARGIDVSSTITPVYQLQMQRIFARPTPDNDSLLRHVQNLNTVFEENGLELGYTALLRTAHMLLQARHHQGAISFGHLALEKTGVLYPNDIASFQLFIVAYAFNANVQGMKWTIASAVHMQYYHKASIYRALKDARNLLKKQIQSSDVKEALRVVEQGLDKVRIQRFKNGEERQAIERATMDIMKKAALEAERQPTSEEALRRRDEVIRQLEEKERREEEERERRESERRQEREARRLAAEESLLQNLGHADAMERILREGRHEIFSDF